VKAAVLESLQHQHVERAMELVAVGLWHHMPSRSKA
jgi:hypothetical protein